MNRVETQARVIDAAPKSRVEMMREALAATRSGENALVGPLKHGDLKSNGRLKAALASAVGVSADSYKTIDPSFHAHAEGRDGLVISNNEGNVYVPMVWLDGTALIEKTALTPAQAVPLLLEDSGERMGAAIEKVMTAFYDRHQPRGVAS